MEDQQHAKQMHILSKFPVIEGFQLVCISAYSIQHFEMISYSGDIRQL